MTTSEEVTFNTIPGMPLVQNGDCVASIIVNAATRANMMFKTGDLLVIAQKIVSKAEGRQVDLGDVVVSPEASQLAEETEKDPRLVELILSESSQVMRQKPGVIIVRHKLGHVGANAGIDQSNVEGDDQALLLPIDPDQSAIEIREKISEKTGVLIGVIICDSLNRPWRLGTTGGAIGCAGLQVLDDHRGGQDMFGNELKVTLINRADSIAAMATLLMGETDEGTPVAIIRGMPQGTGPFGTAHDIHRPLEEDLFD